MNTYKNNMMSVAIALLLSGATLSAAKASTADTIKKADPTEIGQNYDADDTDGADQK